MSPLFALITGSLFGCDGTHNTIVAVDGEEYTATALVLGQMRDYEMAAACLGGGTPGMTLASVAPHHHTVTPGGSVTVRETSARVATSGTKVTTTIGGVQQDALTVTLTEHIEDGHAGVVTWDCGNGSSRSVKVAVDPDDSCRTDLLEAEWYLHEGDRDHNLIVFHDGTLSFYEGDPMGEPAQHTWHCSSVRLNTSITMEGELEPSHAECLPSADGWAAGFTCGDLTYTADN